MIPIYSNSCCINTCIAYHKPDVCLFSFWQDKEPNWWMMNHESSTNCILGRNQTLSWTYGTHQLLSTDWRSTLASNGFEWQYSALVEFSQWSRNSTVFITSWYGCDSCCSTKPSRKSVDPIEIDRLYVSNLSIFVSVFIRVVGIKRFVVSMLKLEKKL